MSEFKVSTYDFSPNGRPSVVSLINGGYAIAWTPSDPYGYGTNIRIQRYDASGNRTGNELIVDTTALDPNKNSVVYQSNLSVAILTNGGFVITWEGCALYNMEEWYMYAQRYDASWNAVGNKFKVNTISSTQGTNPSIASLADGGFIIAWISYGGGIYAQKYNADGNSVGEFKIDSDPSYFKSMASLKSGGFVITFLQNGTSVYAQRFDVNEGIIGNKFKVNTSASPSNPTIASLTSGDFVIVWEGNVQDGVYAQRYDISGNSVGSEFKVNTYTISNQFFPNITSLTNGGFIIAWTSNQGNDNRYHDIYAQKYDASGNRIGNEFKVNTDSSDNTGGGICCINIGPLIDEGFVIAWAKNEYKGGSITTSIYLQRYDSEGRPIAVPNALPMSKSFNLNVDESSQSVLDFSTKISDTEDSASALKIKIKTLPTAGKLYDKNNSDIIVNNTYGVNELVYKETSPTAISDSFTYTVVDTRGAAGNKSTVTLNIISKSNKAPTSGTLALSVVSGNQASVNFTSVVSDAEDSVSALQIKIKTLPAAGKLYDKNNAEVVVGNTYAVNELVYKETSTTATSDDFKYSVVDTHNAESKQSSVNINIMTEFRVNTYTTSDQTVPRVATLSNGGFVITWHSNGQDGSNYGIYAQRYDMNGDAVGSEFKVNTYTTEEQFYPSITALSNGGFIITWSSNGQDGSGYGIYAQRYDIKGNAVGSEFKANTYTVSNQMAPGIAAFFNGGFVIAWSSNGQDGSGYGVYAKRYDINGNAVGSEFKVNTYTANNQTGPLAEAGNGPSIAVLSNGGFVIAWHSDGQDGSEWGVYAQRYDSNGSVAGSEFRVNTYTAERQAAPAIVALLNGGFVIAWHSNGQDGSGYGIYSQRYDANGVAVGSELKVNTYTPDHQVYPSIAALSNGGFVIAWYSNRQDGSGYGIYAQRYDASGNTIDNEFRVNTYTANSQYLPSIASLANGGFVITWTSYEQDGSSWGIYAQMFNSEGMPVAPIPNTLPIGESFSLDVNTGAQVGLNFLTKVSDDENLDKNLLKIKVKTLPTAGTLYDKNGAAVVAGNTYDASQFSDLVYKETSTTATSDSFTYAVVDTHNAEGNQSTVTLNINALPVSESFSLNVNEGSQIGFDFSSKISDREDADNLLKIKVKTLPTAGILYDKDNNKVVVENIYSFSELVYKATSPSVSSDSFAYTVIDTKGAESDQSTVTLDVKPNTPPMSSALALSVVLGKQISVNFISVVRDTEDLFSTLKIKLKTLPIAGKLYDKNNNECVIGNTYAVDELQYKETSITATSDSFAYTVVDTKNAESDQSTVTFTISSSETTSSTAASVISSTSDTATSVTTSSTAISTDTTTSISTSTSSDAATSQSTVITTQNTPPQSNYFQLKVNKNGTVDVKFKSVISDKEDSIDKLQIKINHSPECGKLYNVNKEEITLNQPYSALESMLYEPINCTDSKDSFSYVVVDTEGTESNPSSVDISILEGATPYVDIAPIVGIVSLPATQETPILITLSEKVSDDHDNFSELKVKIKSQPSCGKVYDKNNQEMVLNQLYNINGLTYNPSTCAAQTYTFAYSVVDTGGNESKDSEVIIVVSGAGFPSWATAVIAVVGGIGSVVGIGYTAYECYKKLYPDNSEVNSVNKSNGKKEGDGENDYENQYPKLQKNDSPDKTNRIIMDNKELGSMDSSNVMNIGNIVNNNVQQPNAVPISEVRNLLSNNAMADPEQGTNQRYIDPNEIATELQNKIEIGNDLL